MLNTRSLHGLRVVAYIAATPAYQPVTTAKISRQLGLSVSYTESLMKELKEGGVLFAHRGPGGGYLLQTGVDVLSVWDVTQCFEQREDAAEKSSPSPESSYLAVLAAQMHAIEQHFLENFPLADFVKHTPHDSNAQETGLLAKNFKPLFKEALPQAPNSVFDLSNFMQQHAA